LSFPAYVAAAQPQTNFNPQNQTRNAFVMPGLAPSIHVLLPRAEAGEGRDKPRHDEPSCEITDHRTQMAKSLIELRADFQHLRRWRKSVEQAQSYTFKAVITIIVTGFVGAVWLGVKVMLGK
jgi:hypothetical protein